MQYALAKCSHHCHCITPFITDGAPQSFQPESDLRVCVGDPVTFTCTVVDDVPLSEATVWTASGGVECTRVLVHGISLADTCPDTTPGSSIVFMVNGAVQGMDCVEFEFNAAMATENMDDTLIQCRNGSALDPSTLVGSSRLFVEGEFRCIHVSIHGKASQSDSVAIPFSTNYLPFPKPLFYVHILLYLWRINYRYFYSKVVHKF